MPSKKESNLIIIENKEEEEEPTSTNKDPFDLNLNSVLAEERESSIYRITLAQIVLAELAEFAQNKLGMTYLTHKQGINYYKLPYQIHFARQKYCYLKSFKDKDLRKKYSYNNPLTNLFAYYFAAAYRQYRWANPGSVTVEQNDAVIEYLAKRIYKIFAVDSEKYGDKTVRENFIAKRIHDFSLASLPSPLQEAMKNYLSSSENIRIYNEKMTTYITDTVNDMVQYHKKFTDRVDKFMQKCVLKQHITVNKLLEDLKSLGNVPEIKMLELLFDIMLQNRGLPTDTQNKAPLNIRRSVVSDELILLENLLAQKQKGTTIDVKEIRKLCHSVNLKLVQLLGEAECHLVLYSHENKFAFKESTKNALKQNDPIPVYKLTRTEKPKSWKLEQFTKPDESHSVKLSGKARNFLMPEVKNNKTKMSYIDCKSYKEVKGRQEELKEILGIEGELYLHEETEPMSSLDDKDKVAKQAFSEAKIMYRLVYDHNKDYPFLERFMLKHRKEFIPVPNKIKEQIKNDQGLKGLDPKDVITCLTPLMLKEGKKKIFLPIPKLEEINSFKDLISFFKRRGKKECVTVLMNAVTRGLYNKEICFLELTAKVKYNPVIQLFAICPTDALADEIIQQGDQYRKKQARSTKRKIKQLEEQLKKFQPEREKQNKDEKNKRPEKPEQLRPQTPKEKSKVEKNIEILKAKLTKLVNECNDLIRKGDLTEKEIARKCELQPKIQVLRSKIAKKQQTVFDKKPGRGDSRYSERQPRLSNAPDALYSDPTNTISNKKEKESSSEKDKQQPEDFDKEYPSMIFDK